MNKATPPIKIGAKICSHECNFWYLEVICLGGFLGGHFEEVSIQQQNFMKGADVNNPDR